MSLTLTLAVALDLVGAVTAAVDLPVALDLAVTVPEDAVTEDTAAQ